MAGQRKRLGTLERRLGYVFRDQRLLRRALTHKSAGADNFERFEFLGDAALGFVVGRMLFDALPDATEHRLTLMRASLVHGASLAAVAKDLDLGAFLELGAGERKSGVATRSSVLADALEAVLGAVVCDGGIESAEGVARRVFADRLAVIGDNDLKDPKTKLQEILQSRHLEVPIYEVIDSGRARPMNGCSPRSAARTVSVCGVRARGEAAANPKRPPPQPCSISSMP